MNAVVVQYPNSAGFRAIPRIASEMRRLQSDALWLTVHEDRETGLQNFTPDLVQEFRRLVDDMRQARPGMAPPSYAVVQSADPDYFSMGGDLRFFRECIQRRDAVRLRDYSMRCLDLLLSWSGDLHEATTSIALVPFFTVALAIFTAFPMFSKLQGALQTWLVQSLIPDNIARQVPGYLTQFSRQANKLGIAGLAVLLVTAIALILTIDRTLNGIWRVKKARSLAQRVLIYWAAITLGPLLLAASLAALVAAALWTVAFIPGHAGEAAVSVLVAQPREAVSLLGKPLVPPALSAAVRARLEADLANASAALTRSPGDPEALIWVGRRLGYLGRYREAVSVFTRGVERFPSDARFLRHRGHRYITLDRWRSRAAYEVFRKTFAEDYSRLDEWCERLVEHERTLGVTDDGKD